jgi:hypothetical protein
VYLTSIFATVERYHTKEQYFKNMHETRSKDGRVSYVMPHLIYTVHMKLSPDEHLAWILAANSEEGRKKYEKFKLNAPCKYVRDKESFVFTFSPPPTFTPSPEVVGEFILKQAMKAFRLAGF